jgi:hypothetical protein
MGKRKAAFRAAAPGDSRRREQDPCTFSTFAAAPDPFFGSSLFETGLCIVRRQSSVGYLAVFGLTVTLSVFTLLACTASLPRLLTHWTWMLFTLFSGTVFVGRWLYPDTEAALLMLFTLTLHGLLWLALVLVPLRGVTPSTLWHAFGVHGGDQLLPAQMGDLLLLGAPPLALLGFCVMERRYLLVLLHDVLSQLPPGMSKFFFLWQVFSPVLPLAIWSACMRQPIFSDLPVWPGVAPVMTICFVANVPPLAYAYWRILPLQGAAHWFEGGVILWSASAF